VFLSSDLFAATSRANRLAKIAEIVIGVGKFEFASWAGPLVGNTKRVLNPVERLPNLWIPTAKSSAHGMQPWTLAPQRLKKSKAGLSLQT